MKTKTILAAMAAIAMMATGALAAGGYNAGFKTTAQRSMNPAASADDQLAAERNSLSNCWLKTAAQKKISLGGLGFLPYEDEARCRVETGLVPSGAGTPAAVEVAKIAEWEKVLGGAKNYLSRTEARFTGKTGTNPLGKKVLGISLGTMAEDVPGLADSTKRGRNFTLWNYDGRKIPYTAFEKADEYSQVLMTTVITTPVGGKKIVEIKKLEGEQEPAIAKAPAPAPAAKEDGGFFGKLKNMGQAVIDGMADSGKSSAPKKPVYQVGARETKQERESVVHDFAGVKVWNVQYLFDKKQGYIGFFGIIANRTPFSPPPEPQLINDLFQGVIKIVGMPTAVIKTPHVDVTSKVIDNHATFITPDNMRIDVHCEDFGDKTCQNGFVQVRSLTAGTFATRDVTNFFE